MFTSNYSFQQKEQDPTNLYVANLPEYVEDSYLENMVQPYGTVISTRILRDQGMLTHQASLLLTEPCMSLVGFIVMTKDCTRNW